MSDSWSMLVRRGMTLALFLCAVRGGTGRWTAHNLTSDSVHSGQRRGGDRLGWISPALLPTFHAKPNERSADRVEIYRPLVADPKEARRKRATRRGKKL